MLQDLQLVIPVEWEGDGNLLEIEEEVKRYVLENIQDFLMDAWLEKG